MGISFLTLKIPTSCLLQFTYSHKLPYLATKIRNLKTSEYTLKTISCSIRGSKGVKPPCGGGGGKRPLRKEKESKVPFLRISHWYKTIPRRMGSCCRFIPLLVPILQANGFIVGRNLACPLKNPHIPPLAIYAFA